MTSSSRLTKSQNHETDGIVSYFLRVRTISCSEKNVKPRCEIIARNLILSRNAMRSRQRSSKPFAKHNTDHKSFNIKQPVERKVGSCCFCRGMIGRRF